MSVQPLFKRSKVHFSGSVYLQLVGPATPFRIEPNARLQKMVMRFSFRYEKLIYLLILFVVQGICVDCKIASQLARFYDTAGVCKEAGYKRNETDSSQFYRCVDFYGSGEKYVIFKFSCPPALEFDEELSSCVFLRKSPILVTHNNPNLTTTLAAPEFSSSTPINPINEFDVDHLSITVVPATSNFANSPGSFIAPSTFETVTSSSNSVLQAAEVVVESSEVIISTLEMNCSSNKFYRLPDSDCNRFYQCHQRSVSIFSCAPGLVFDEGMERCVLLEESSCDQQFIKPNADNIFDYSEIDCISGTPGNFYRYPFDCRNFYQCFNNGLTKSILFYSCTSGLVFDEKSANCLLPQETSPCYANDSPFRSSPFLYNLQRLFQSSPNEFSSK